MELERLASIFEAASVIELRPTDLLVFRANCAMTLEERAVVYSVLEEQTGHPRILILEEGAELAIIRPTTEAADAAAVDDPPAPAMHRPISGASSEIPKAAARVGAAPGAIA